MPTIKPLSPGKLYSEIKVEREVFEGPGDLEKESEPKFVQFCKSMYKRFPGLGANAQYSDEYKEAIKSDYADILQCSVSPGPDHIHAATFLSHFIGENTPWVHLDLSCEENKGGLGLVGTDVTGFGVRWSI